ncbi:hypothetical protein [Pseudomonas nunensis]|uniref:hypothetical protein n=1 Tax=Pseudomonas nunensis TaxID=2961896 RepID=UPI0025B06D15|nr:hypothetical protein [Pseudomonas nunensis]MDN3221510.1 hypothetical protein [Pseudomonas nunensis]
MHDAIKAPHSELRFSRPFNPADDSELLKKSDLVERQNIVQALKNSISGQPDQKDVYWEDCFIPMEPGSSFEQTLKPAAALLHNLIATPAFKSILQQRRVHIGAEIYVVVSGRIIALFNGSNIDLTDLTRSDPDLESDLDTLIDLAEIVGGVVFQTDLVGIAQWLTFHEYELPEKVTHTKNLIKHLEFEYTPGPSRGDYWDLITGERDISIALSPAERDQIRSVTRQQMRGEGKLLDLLSQIALGHRAYTLKRLNCNELLRELAAHPIARSWSKDYITVLDWYGANSGEAVSDLYLDQVLMTAILLDLHPAVGEGEPRNHVAGYNLYAPENIEKPTETVISELERHLVENHEIGESSATLAAYLLLTGLAPEFLVANLPSTLLLGTPDWVTFCRGVALAEINAPGSARLMTYSKVLQLEAMDPVHQDLEDLYGLLAVDPIIDWALLNSVITLDELSHAYPASVHTAMAAYQKHAELFVQVATSLATPLPTRKLVALEMLQKIVPDCDFLEEEILHPKINDEVFLDSVPQSMVELHMSGNLNVHWDLKKHRSLYQTYPRLLPDLTSAEDEFSHLFNQAYVPFKEGMATSIKLALSTLPPIDRQRLLGGDITFFTVRPSVAAFPPISPLAVIDPSWLIDSSHRTPIETQRNKDQATGRYGVILCSEFEGRLYCYELFSLHGNCQENPQLATLIFNKNLLKLPSRLSFSGRLSEGSRPADIHVLPTDIESYTHGVKPGLALSSQGVIDKLGTLPSAVKTKSNSAKGYYQSYYGGEFDAVAEFILNHRPLWTHEELIEESRGKTKLELKN